MGSSTAPAGPQPHAEAQAPAPAQTLGGPLPGGILSLRAATPRPSGNLYVLWYTGAADSSTMLRWYADNIDDYNAMGIRINWIPVPTPNAPAYDASCFSSFRGLVACSAPGYRARSNSGASVLARNANAYVAFARQQRLNLSDWILWQGKSGWAGSASLSRDAGRVAPGQSIGMGLRQLAGDLNLAALLQHTHWIAQPGLSGNRVLYVFWDPDCVYCHYDFVRIAHTLGAIRAANPTLSIRWVPIGILKANSLNKAAQSLGGYAFMRRDATRYDSRNESGGLIPTPDVDPALLRQASQNTRIFHAMSLGETPTYMWTVGGNTQMSFGSPKDMTQFLRTIR